MRFVAAVAVVGCGGSPAAPPPDAGCDGSRIALIESTGDGVIDRLHVQVTHDGQPAALLVDTGSPTTFLQEPLGSPDPVRHAGTVDIGCDSVELDGRPEVADDPIAGLPSIGTLGVDRLLPGPSEIELDRAAIAFAGLDDTTAWPTSSYDVVLGLVLVHASLDGMPVRLMLDTGSPDALWLGQQPQPGDVETDATDAEGNIVKLYKGTATLTIGDSSVVVPIVRAPSFPYFEQTVAALGGNVHGLLGLSAMAHAVVLDGAIHIDR